ncbi:MAG TPA: GNAT family N-acetyltransferase [Gammaproteobacteria bacterium]
MTASSPKLRFREAAAGDGAAIRAVVVAVMAEYGLSSDLEGNDADLRDVVGSYAGRGGSFRVVTSAEGDIVGCGGLYPIDEREAEIRRMYLLPSARGLGVGRTLLEELIAFAEQRRFERVVLETASVLKEAISLYCKRGFVPVARRGLALRQCDQAYALQLATYYSAPSSSGFSPRGNAP